LDLPHLKVFVAVPEYLLAMKCLSMRIGKDETDIRDVRFLMKKLGLRQAEAVLELVEKLALVSEAPLWIEASSHADCNAYWAAMVETLCREAELQPPDWTESPCCYLHRPWFPGGLESLKAVLLAESPVPFRRRNLFVSANALTRA